MIERLGISIDEKLSIIIINYGCRAAILDRVLKNFANKMDVIEVFFEWNNIFNFVRF